MSFTAVVEPPEPMRGLEIPEPVVDGLGAGKRPPVVVTLNGHSWRTRVAIMRGRYLIGLSRANREAAGVAIGDTVQVSLALDTAPRTVPEPAELTAALDADPVARAAWEALSFSHRRAHVHAINGAKKPETRARRVEQAISAVLNP